MLNNRACARTHQCFRALAAIVAGLVVLSLPWAQAYSQDRATIPSAYTHLIKSKLNGADYKLTVVVPSDYDGKAAARYPTLYVMDGNRWAMLLATMLPRLWSVGMLPKIIVVGIDYPGASGRNQDYGPVTQRYFPMDAKRGAANFIRVVKEEIIPYVESRYRADPADRGIGGHSMGGLFTAYALLHETDTFQRFWISSPSLFFEDEVLFKDFSVFNSKSLSKPLYVFTNAGGDELPEMQGTLERFGAKLLEHASDKIVLETWIQPGENHTTVVTSVFIKSLEHLYMYRPRFIPAASDLLRFAGQYKMPDGTIVSLVSDGRDLLYRDSSVEFHSGSLVRLKAYAPNKFFVRTPRAEFEFLAVTGVPSQVRYYDATKGESVDAIRLP